jgi:hypothetical protein
LAAGLGLGGVFVRAAPRATSAATAKCPNFLCPQGYCLWCEMSADYKECVCGCSKCASGGIAGGGALRTDGGGEAQVAVFATRTEVPGRPGTYAVVGQVRWTDPAWEGAGLALETTTVTYYGPLEGVEGGRAAAGWMRADQAPGAYPFLLRAVDAGPPGSGKDTLALWVGDAVGEEATLAAVPVPEAAPSGFRYAAKGTLVSGDLQLLSLAATAEDAATPAP